MSVGGGGKANYVLCVTVTPCLSTFIQREIESDRKKTERQTERQTAECVERG